MSRDLSEEERVLLRAALEFDDSGLHTIDYEDEDREAQLELLGYTAEGATLTLHDTPVDSPVTIPAHLQEALAEAMQWYAEAHDRPEADAAEIARRYALSEEIAQAPAVTVRGYEAAV